MQNFFLEGEVFITTLLTIDANHMELGGWLVQWFAKLHMSSEEDHKMLPHSSEDQKMLPHSSEDNNMLYAFA